MLQVHTIRQCGMECSVMGCDGFSFEALSGGGRCHLNFETCSPNLSEEYVQDMNYFQLI